MSAARLPPLPLPPLSSARALVRELSLPPCGPPLAASASLLRAVGFGRAPDRYNRRCYRGIRQRRHLDEHQPVSRELDHVAVVADDNHRAVIAVQRLDQCLAASTSRWLVGSSRISRCGASRVISASASRRALRRRACRPAWSPCRPRNQPAELGANRGGRRAGHRAGHMFERRLVAVQFLDLILGEIADRILPDAFMLPSIGGSWQRAGAPAWSCRCRCGRAARSGHRDRCAG